MEKLSAAVLILVLSGLLLSETCWGLKIAAFNIQVFGPTKMGKPAVVDILAKIVRRYDITAVQEIRDTTGNNVLQPFLDVINSDSGGYTYSMAVSGNLGRSTQKERLAYIYRKETVEVLQAYQYTDPFDDFERDPFSVKFRSRTGRQSQNEDAAQLEFFLLGDHIKPDSVCRELDALELAYSTTSKHFGGTSGFLLGDFNAGCSYLTGCPFQDVSVVSNPNFFWLVDCAMDTTVKHTYCAYDRIVAEGGLKDCVVPDSVKVFRFDLEYSLLEEQAQDVSDHYPVEFQLTPHCSCLKSIRILSFTATDDRYAASKGPHSIGIVTQTEVAAYRIKSIDFWSRETNEIEVNFKSDFGFSACVRRSDIKEVAVVPMSNDGWKVKTIVTFVCEFDGRCTLLTQDLDVNYWVDKDGGLKAPLVLTLA